MNNNLSGIIMTIVALILIPAMALAVYPVQFMTLELFMPILMVILAAYGIQAIQKIISAKYAGSAIMDLLPGLIADRVLVGIDALFSITWLTLNYAMPWDQYTGLVVLILGSLGLLHLARK